MKPTLLLSTALLLGLASRGDPLPDLVPGSLQVPSTVTAPPNPQVTVSFTVTNQGPGEAGSYWNDLLYFSTKPFIDSTAIYVDYESGPGVLEPGDTYSRTVRVSLPLVRSGAYYLILRVNSYNYLAESNPDNNELAAAFSFESTPADLAPLSLVVTSSITGPPIPEVTVAWGVTNLGPGTAAGYWSDSLFLSSKPTLDWTASSVIYQGESGPVAAGGTYWRTNTARLPVTQSGTYYLLFKTDQDNSLYESQTNNNVTVAQFTFKVQPPDLVPLALLVPNSLTGAPNPVLNLVWGVTNQGIGPAIGNYNWNDRVYFSTDTNLDQADSPIAYGYEYGPVGPGETYWRSNTAVLPVVESGNYFLIFQTAAPGGLYESDTNNNLLVVPIAVTIQKPDLVPLTRLPTEITGPPLPYVNLVFGATNQGVGSALGSWSDFVFFSSNALAPLQSSVASSWHYGPVPPGTSYWQTNTGQLPVVQDGTYYLTIASDYYSNLYESDRSNNLVTVPVTVHILPPDLAPIALRLPTVVTSPPNPELRFIWGITNQGTGPAVGNWYWSDLVYCSSNSFWDSTAEVLNSSFEQGPVKAGAAYWRTNTLRLPIVRSGRYYFFLKADAYDYLIESTKQNNQLMVAVDFVIQPPDLVPVVSEIPPSFTGPPNPDVTLVWGVTNQGTGLAKSSWAGWSDAVYFSTNPYLDNQDTSLNGYLDGGPLAAGDSYWHTNLLQVPVTQSGTYYLIFKADNWDAVFETDKRNNVAVVPITFTVLPPDLTPLGVQVPAELTGPPNPSLTMAWGVTNQGIGPALPISWSWSDTVFLSRNASWDASDIALSSLYENGPVQPGESYWRTNTFHVPVVRSTNCFLIFKTDSSDAVFESNETNNTVAVPLKVNILPPDLAPVAFLAPSSVTNPPRPTVTFVWGVTNQGTGEADPGSYWAWYDQIQISTNSVLDSSATYVYTSTEATRLPAGRSYWRTNSCQLPVLASGTYYLFFTTDTSQTLYESTFTNNTVSVPITFTIQPPDLAPLNLVVSSNLTGPPNPEISLAWGITNLGPGSAEGYWNDSLYFSSKPVLDSSAVWVTYRNETGPVPAGGRYWRTNTVQLPVVQSGTYFLLFKTDQDNTLYETQTNNNVLAVPFTLTIQRPDLVPLSRLPAEITGPPYPSVNLVYGGTNQGLGAALGSWSDYLFFATNADAGAQGSAFGYWHYGTVSPGGAYWVTNGVRLPVTQDGTYYFTLASDFYSNLYESDRANNLLTVPVTVHILPPDLAPISLQMPTVVTSPPNPELTFIWGITNQGIGPAIGNWYWSDVLSISNNAAWGDSTLTLNSSYENGPVEPGDAYWRTNTLRLPILESGRYYFFFKTDATESLIESDEQNNQLVVAADFLIQPPDLIPLVSTIPSTFTGPPYPSLSLVWGVTNQGIGLAKGPWPGWSDAIYFSTDPILDGQDSRLTTADGSPLAPATSYWHTNSVRVPVTKSGTYYLIFNADDWNYVYESDEDNNLAVVPISITVLPPDLMPIALQAPAELTGPPNPNLSLVWGVTNQGTGPALPLDWSWYDAVYLSRDATWDSSDYLINSWPETGPVPAGDSYWRTNLIQVPAVRSTNFYLIFKTDSSGSVYESNEANNTFAVPLKVTIQSPDLAPVTFLAPNAFTSPPLPNLTFVWAVTNQGPGLADPGHYGAWYDRIRISTSSVLDETALDLGTSTETTPVPSGSSYWRTNTYTVPVTQSGTCYVFFTADCYQGLYESTFANNTVSLPITFTIQPPDLAVLDFKAPPVFSGPPKPSVTLSWGVTNQGIGAAIRSWSDSVYFSSRPVFDYSAVRLGSYNESGPLEVGGVYWRTNDCKLPVTQDGQYYLFFMADDGNALYESDAGNNLKSVPVTVSILPPDLAPIALEVTNLVIGPPSPSVTFVWGITNQGAGAAIGDWAWRDQLSLCPGPDPDVGGCTSIAASYEPGPIAPATAYWRTNTVRVPVVQSGTYYLRLTANIYGELYESAFHNNQLIVPVTFQIQPPDLAPIVLRAPSVVSGAPYPQVKLSWGVTNQGAGMAWGDGSWADAVYFSSKPVFDYSARAVVWNWEYGQVPPGGNYWRSQTVNLPTAESGSYYLIFQADANRVLYDSDYTNNTFVVPITVNISPPDLRPLAFQAPTNISNFQATNVTFVWAVTNQGTAPAAGTWGWSDTVLLSSSPQGTWYDTVVFSTSIEEALPPGGTYWRTNTVLLPPVQSGNYYFIFRTDASSSVQESDENNNTLTLPVQINLAAPDLKPVVLAVENTITGPPDPLVTIIYAIANQGAGVAWSRDACLDGVYLSRTNVLDGSESGVAWSYEQGPVLPGASYWRTNTVRLPVTQNGSYYLLLKTDIYNSLSETSETNNVLAVPFTFNIKPSDVALIGLQGPQEMTASPYSKIILSWGVTNQGSSEALAGWGWWQAVYLSTNRVMGENALYLASFPTTNSLPAGATDWFTNEIILPQISAGQYYLLVSANAGNGLVEDNVSNDLAVLPFKFSMVLPDLAPLPLSVPDKLTTPPDPWIALSWGVTNQGLGAAEIPTGWCGSYWSDYLWLSTSSNLDSTARFVSSLQESNSIASGQDCWRTNIVRLPVTQSGSYYLIFDVNGGRCLAESDLNNNTVVVPIAITVTPPDLAPLFFQAPTRVTGYPNPEITLAWGVTNQGVGPAQVPYADPGYWSWPLADALYISATPTLDDPWYRPIAALWPLTNDMPAGTSYTKTNTVRLPISNSGTYYFIFRTDAFQTVTESDESNNTFVLPVTFDLSPPADLTVLAFVVPRTISETATPSVTVAWHVINQGLGPTAGSWWDLINLGSPANYEIPVASVWVNQYLVPGGDYWLTNTVTLPLNSSGDYQLTLHVGTGYGLFDLDTQDNVITVPFTLNIVPPTPVRLADPQALPNGIFRLAVYGGLGSYYTLQASTDLQHWYHVLDFECYDNPTMVYDLAASRYACRFYRVVPLTNY